MKIKFHPAKVFACLLFVFALNNFHSLHAQNNSSSVSGKVTDDSGAGLSGVTVTVSGTSVSTMTASDGTYQIDIPSGKRTLSFSFVGYESQTVSVDGRAVINISLGISREELENAIVIGYGTQKKKDVTGAVSSFDARKLEERPIERVDQALVGQMAGVTVKQTTGIPGKAFSVQIRGSGSISGGNEPLYVIDGFPLTPNSSNTGNGSFSTGNPLDNINPNDIESIQVLKDAAAAAIYGSRASNGVVLITTKQGRTGKPKIALNVYGGYNQASKKLQMQNGDQWIATATEVINAQYLAQYGSAGATVNDDYATRLAFNGGAFNANYLLDPRWSMAGHPGLEYVDWQNAIERKGQIQNYELSASGATNAVKYYVSGNYANQDGFVIGVGYKAYSLRANIEANVSKRLKFGLNVAPTYSITQDPGVEGKDQIFHQALSLGPVQEDTMGLFVNSLSEGQYAWSSSTNSPYAKLLYRKGTSKRYRTLGTIYGEYEIIPGLVFRSSVNLDNTDNATTAYSPYVIAGTQAARRFTGSNNLLAATSGSYNSYRRQTFVNENTLTYNKVIKNNHSLNLLAGYSYNMDRFDAASMSSNGGFTSAVIQTLNAAAAITGNTTSTKSILISYFGRLLYNYKSKYYVSASLRRDGSSRFGINNQFGIFPSASLKWIATQEKFMQGVAVISDLGIRASYGVNGNNNLPNDYASIATIGSAGYVLGATQAAVIGQSPNVLANPDLKWEKSQTYDFGLDFGILKNRITGSFDVYNKLNTDLLLNVQVPEATGFQTALTNIGSVRNIGQELEITSHNMVGEFQWNTTLTIAHNSNKIVALAPGQTQIIIPNSFDVSNAILRVGSPINSVYVLKTTGFLTEKDIADGVAQYGTKEQPGDFKYQDTDNSGSITEADKVIVGHPNPDYTYGITNTFRYKGFDLNVFVQGQSGGTIYSELGRALTRAGQGRSDNRPASYDQRWKSPANQGEGRFSKAYATFLSPITAATDWVYSSDYIRVRNITLGYNLKNLFRANYVQGARIYFSLENFFGHDKYTNGLNPEAANTTVSSNSAYPEAGDYGAMPLPKSLIAGLNITF
jgi:TonB-linked SusC/RagA family outer membrane protein